MKLTSGTIAFRYTLCLTVLSWALISCGGGGGNPKPPPPPANNGGPQFVINSPVDSTSVSGATFFSVQPFNPSEVQDVQFRAGSTELAVDAPGEDKFKVFLIPRDFPDGPLTLTATVTGTNGKKSEESVTVNVVGNPPSTATVGRDGAILGTQEPVTGAISTLAIPAGVGEGARVSFEARTKEQVKQETGVDYDALGVTFLGAQDIDSSQPLEQTLMVSSGGFGPMVQPGQAVVNYMIAPDGDGNGVGELVVVNTATVAPNGDVISDPTSGIQVGDPVSLVTSSGTSNINLRTASVSARPGTLLELETVGMNPFSSFGNIAVIEAGGKNFSLNLASVLPHPNDDEKQITRVVVPNLLQGKAKLALVNVTTGDVSRQIDITIEPLPSLKGTIEGAYSTYFKWLKSAIENMPGTDDSIKTQMLLQVDDIRSQLLNELKKELRPEIREALHEGAVIIETLPLTTMVQAASVSPSAKELNCKTVGAYFAAAGFSTLFGLIATGAAVIGTPTALTVAGVAGVVGVAYGLYAAAKGYGPGFSDSFGAASSTLGHMADLDKLHGITNSLFKTISTQLGAIGTGLSLQSFIEYWGYRTGCQKIKVKIPPPRRPTPPRLTGMGSAPPPGGDAGGQVTGNFGSAGSSLNVLQLKAPDASLAGRVTVKVFAGGNPTPFSGITDESGYFFVPFIPEGQPFTALATDAETRQTRTFEGIGPAMGESTYIFFDFISEDGTSTKNLQYDSNVTGRVEGGGTNLYTFSGRAGDAIRVGLNTTGVVSGSVAATVLSPSNVQIDSTSGSFNQSSYSYTCYTCSFELSPNTLPETGTYVISVGNSGTEAVDYTLGLALWQEPTPLNVTNGAAQIEANLSTLGDRQSYSFNANAGDVVGLELNLPTSSQMATLMTVLGPLEPNEYTGSGLLVYADKRNAEVGPFTLAGSGTYTIYIEAIRNVGDAIRPLEGLTGAWSATLRKPTPKAINLDSNVTGTITGNNFDVYTFEGKASDYATFAILAEQTDVSESSGQSLYTAITPPGYATNGTINRPLSTLTAGFNGLRFYNSSYYPVELPENGTYTVIVEGYVPQDDIVFEPVAYTFGLGKLDAPQAINATSPSSSATGRIDVLGDVQAFTFTGQANDVYNFILSHPSDSSLTATLSVFSPDSTQFPGTYFSGTPVTTEAIRSQVSGETSLPKTGTYTVWITPTYDSREVLNPKQFLGNFRVTLERK